MSDKVESSGVRRKSNETVFNEMESNGINSGDHTDIAEMLNSNFLLRLVKMLFLKKKTPLARFCTSKSKASG